MLTQDTATHIRTEAAKVLVGQEEPFTQLLIALFARGHCLFVGVPGLAKTLLIQTLSDVLDLAFGRIQFTPDLMPSDITGTDVLEEDRATGRRVGQGDRRGRDGGEVGDGRWLHGRAVHERRRSHAARSRVAWVASPR